MRLDYESLENSLELNNSISYQYFWVLALFNWLTTNIHYSLIHQIELFRHSKKNGNSVCSFEFDEIRITYEFYNGKCVKFVDILKTNELNSYLSKSHRTRTMSILTWNNEKLSNKIDYNFYCPKFYIDFIYFQMEIRHWKYDANNIMAIYCWQKLCTNLHTHHKIAFNPQKVDEWTQYVCCGWK